MKDLSRKWILVVALELIVSMSHAQEFDDRVVIINFSQPSNLQLSRLIERVCESKSKVVAIDIMMAATDDKIGDQYLIDALWDCNKLLLPTEVRRDGDDLQIVDLYMPPYIPVFAKRGFVSAKVEKTGKAPINFNVSFKSSVSGYREFHFSIQAAMAFDSLAATRFLSKHDVDDMVEMDLVRTNRRFRILTLEQGLSGAIGQFDHKIVLIGYTGPGNGDLFYYPKPLGRGKRKIHGVEVLANIVAQVLDN